MGYPKILFDNRLRDGGLTASSTASDGFSIANVTDFRPYSYWKPGNEAQPSIVVDVSAGGLVKTGDYLLIHSHTLGSKGPTTVNLYGSNTPSFSPTPLESVVVALGDDSPVFLQFASQAWNYWKIEWVVNNPSNPPEAAIIALGSALVVPSYIRESFDPTTRKVHGLTNISMQGNPLGKIIDWEEWQQSVTFELLSWQWVRQTFLPAWEIHLRGIPFVFSWDPQAHPEELLLVNAGDAFTTPHRAGELADLTLEMVGIAPSFGAV